MRGPMRGPMRGLHGGRSPLAYASVLSGPRRPGAWACPRGKAPTARRPVDGRATPRWPAGRVYAGREGTAAGHVHSARSRALSFAER